VEECTRSGITEVLFVASAGKEAIIDYFDRSHELESMLEHRGKDDALQKVQAPATMAVFFSIRQGEIKGLGHAVSKARTWVGDEPFAVILPDDLVLADEPCLGQLKKVFEAVGRPVVALEEVAWEETGKYGIVAGEPGPGGSVAIREMVEKPQPEIAPSNLAIIGRYILTPEIFDLLAGTKEGTGGEVQLTDALRMLIPKGIYGYKFEGKRCDAGSPLGFLEANLSYALHSPALKPKVLALMKKLLEPG
jgi:UTP--glucose-1-phosphate uridylyltransferase